jgi:hypothetical protein
MGWRVRPRVDGATRRFGHAVRAGRRPLRRCRTAATADQPGLRVDLARLDSFTHVSPALYHVNYDYQSGPARLLNESDDFDGLTAAEICQRAHDAQLRCEPLVYAGAGNSGTNLGIHHILDDSCRRHSGSAVL